MCLCSLSRADSSPTTYWLVSLNAFCQPKRERGKERENSYERKGRVVQYSVKQREKRGWKRIAEQREGRRGNGIGMEAKWKKKKDYINQRRIKNKYISVLFSFFASLGRHSNKSMATAEKYWSKSFITTQKNQSNFKSLSNVVSHDQYSSMT